MELTRPNGKLYRSRKPPAAEFFEGDWFDKTYCLVYRCEDENEARALADEEIRFNDPACQAGDGVFSWWRKTIRNNESYWEHDNVRGVPGWSFEVVEYRP